MKMTVTHPEYGEIRLDWGFWTGKYTLYFNGNELPKTGKRSFAYTDPESGEPVAIVVSGTIFKGQALTIGTKHILMSPAAKWYDIVFAIIPALILFYFVGGAIGGGLGGAFGFLGLFLIKNAEKMSKKVLYCLAFSGISAAVGLVVSLLVGMLYIALGLA